ncbi:MAG: glycosyltransferase [Planctomycetes bacterium]|nr:glycosyltransferase [Planctomycetota bacterium]
MAKKKVLIVSVKAGAGHIRAAQAIEETFKAHFPDIEVNNIESLEYTNTAFQKTFTGTYEKLAKDLPSVWGYIYEHLEKKPADSKAKKLATILDRANAKPLRKKIEEYNPDAIICTHYFPAEIMGQRKLKGKLKSKIYVTLTDYDIHTMWIQSGVDMYSVATEEMAFALREKGIGDAGVKVTGIPIMPIFSAKYPSRDKMREKLGLRQGVPTVLSSAGGFGLGGVDKSVALLADSVEDVQIIAVAGKNEKLKMSLDKVAADRNGKIVPFGFVNNMHELMAASDFAVAKSGGLTSSECLALGLPMLIISPIPGQEERNSDFLLENGVALKSNSPAHLMYKFKYLLENPKRLEEMTAATKRIAKPDAALDIVKMVVEGL